MLLMVYFTDFPNTVTRTGYSHGIDHFKNLRINKFKIIVVACDDLCPLALLVK